MNLFDIIACPTCKVRLERAGDTLTCTRCGQRYPIIEGKPVLYPDGSVPENLHEGDLLVRSDYAPWHFRVILQSLPPSAIVLDLGSGNMAVDLPNVIRMDTLITPFADVVGDGHALPFLPGIFDYILSLAVVEHLRNPFLAAQEMYDALRPGGYVYGDCNFMFPYHGYPHHYFNASEQGMEQAFAPFQKLHSGVAPFQMPSFAIRPILENYYLALGHGGSPDAALLREMLADLIAMPLSNYDSHFDEQGALRLAAGTYFVGVKLPDGVSEVIPQAIQDVYAREAGLRERFPNLFDLTRADNSMRWALGEGRAQYPEIDAALSAAQPFQKHDTINQHWLDIFASWPVLDPVFGAIPDTLRKEPAQSRQQLVERIQELEASIGAKNQHIAELERLIDRIGNGRVMRLLRWASGK